MTCGQPKFKSTPSQCGSANSQADAKASGSLAQNYNGKSNLI